MGVTCNHEQSCAARTVLALRAQRIDKRGERLVCSGGGDGSEAASDGHMLCRRVTLMGHAEGHVKWAKWGESHHFNQGHWYPLTGDAT